MASEREEALADIYDELCNVRDRIQRKVDLTDKEKHDLIPYDNIANCLVQMDEARRDRLADAAWYRRQNEASVRGLSHAAE